MLKINKICHAFNSGTLDERCALDGISLTLKEGDFAIIIGSNGAGKSTLLNAIGGDILPDTGSIVIDDIDVTPLITHKRSKWVSRVYQDPMSGTAASMTIEENLTLAELRGKKRTLSWGLKKGRRDSFRDLLSEFHLGLEDRLTAKVETLSGGQRQALSLLMAVITRPSVLLLDEHTAALDPGTAAKVMEATLQAIKLYGLTTLMVTHNMQHALDYGNQLIMLEKGGIRLTLDEKEKRGMTVEKLVDRFHLQDDKMLLEA